MTEKTYNVLFLCTGNSARSIMAEAITNAVADGRFKGYSAGSHPAGRVHPDAIETLRLAHLPTEGYRSKGWDEFAEAGAPQMDFVFTVCDSAAGEMCPIWPGHPTTAHWGIEDPAAATGAKAEVRAAFYEAFRQLRNRIELFAALPIASLDRMTLKARVDAIGRSRLPAEKAD